MAVGYTNTWYLYALAAYLLVARLAVRLPLRVALGAAAVVAVLADTPVAPRIGTAAGLMANLLFFLVGALAPGWVDTLLARADPRATARVVAAYLPLAGLAVAAGVSRLGVFSTLLSVFGKPAGVLLAVRAADTRPAALLARLGRVTLPVYVLHLPLLALLHAAVPALPPGRVVLATLYPVLAVLALTAVALAVHAALVRCGLGVLFRLPRTGRDLASVR
jgi:threonine dehydratase